MPDTSAASVVVAVDVGEARRSESQKGLDGALTPGRGARKASMANREEACGGAPSAAHAGRYLALSFLFLQTARGPGLQLEPRWQRRRRFRSAESGRVRAPRQGMTLLGRRMSSVGSGRGGGQWRNMPQVLERILGPELP